MRRFTTAALALTIAATGLLAGALAVAAKEGSDLKIGLVTDVGTIDDRNFNQYSWEGTQAGAKAIGAAEPQYAISQTSTDIGPNIQAFVDQAYDVIVTVGFAAGADTIMAAKANPDIKFIGVDQAPCITPEGDPDDTFTCAGDPATLLPNLQGLNWREQQPGYLAGIVAASISKTGHIAAVGGTNVVPAVPNYIEGYANGAKSINPDAVVTVTYVSGAPDTAAFGDPAGGQAIAQQLLAQDPDIDVMFQVAGKTGNGVLQAACDAGIYAIGVDVDQFKSTPETAACTVTSAEKKLEVTVSNAIQRIGAGTDVGGTLYFDISDGSVGISPFHDFKDLITEETRQALADAEAALADGSLQACEAQEGTGFCVVTLP
jgi:basic membrane protein A and related proteins